MCGGGGGGGGDLSDGANIASGNSEGFTGADYGSFTGGDTHGGWGNAPVGSPEGAGMAISDYGVANTGGQGGWSFTTEPIPYSQNVTLTDKGGKTAFAATAGLLAGKALDYAVQSARGEGQLPGNTSDMGQGIGPSGVAVTVNKPNTAPFAPQPTPSPSPAPTPNVIPPNEVVVNPTTTVEAGRTPAEIDAANKLRAEREKAYAKQRADAEMQQINALAARDVAYTGGPNARLTPDMRASEKYIGTLPPALGQSRHNWA